jgi:hypothetical protein
VFNRSDLSNKQGSPVSARNLDVVLRIRILGSLHWITDLDLDLEPDHALFVSGFHEIKKKYFIFFAYGIITDLRLRIYGTYDNIGTFTSVFKDKMNLKNTKTVQNKKLRIRNTVGHRYIHNVGYLCF